ncbi:hypothetical protein PanWU01x14_359670 [Parasponia andersonii]|uniref:DUF7787 domain-containing protein n=1 Tax=Parasponia andersonii TaxID=3476 RepID=A0A2P5A7W7_PARAD|nr:hypothetical protein PanWU01x14_359670 [Parasponia andersonii]
MESRMGSRSSCEYLHYLQKEEIRTSEKPRSRAKICLEEYLLLFDSHPNCFSLPINHLNQIIGMHGYKKLHKVPKTVLTDVVSTLSLVNPCRSTLNDRRISPLVLPTLDDVVADLNELDWQECFTTSVQTISSDVNHSLVISSTTAHQVPKHHSYADCSNKRRTKRKALSDIGNHGGFLAPPRGAVAELSPKIGRPKKVPRRKRTTPQINGCDYPDGRGNFLALDFFPIGPR